MKKKVVWDVQFKVSMYVDEEMLEDKSVLAYNMIRALAIDSNDPRIEYSGSDIISIKEDGKTLFKGEEPQETVSSTHQRRLTMNKLDELVDEYQEIFEGIEDQPDKKLITAMVEKTEWTPDAAKHVIRLARQYGFLMLENAVAVARVLDVEENILDL